MVLLRIIALKTFFAILQIILAVDPIGTGGPSVLIEGSDALLTCVVTGPYMNNTVLWRRGKTEILSAGMNRVTSDQRIQILHDNNPKTSIGNGGDVWVLLIKNTKTTDTDIYICEVNTDPVIRSFQSLTVQSTPKTRSNKKQSGKLAEPPPVDQVASTSYQLSHDFTDCCEANNVTKKCIGFCNVHNIIDGTTGIEPEACEKDFPYIVKCMADGRNHVPCCEIKGIPDLCQDMCRGEYTPFTDFLKTRISCTQYTLPGLQCILSGIQELPSSPKELYIETVTNSSLKIFWSPPDKLAETVISYTINLTILHEFDPNEILNIGNLPTRSITVANDVNNYLVTDLQPMTMYTISVIAHNKHGDSLPSDRIRAFTFKTHDLIYSTNSTKIIPKLPDIRTCCEQSGMSHRMCLDKMCDPKMTSMASLPDFMVCAPWANITFQCLANNIDHTECCTARGLSSDCLPLCSGKIFSLNFSLFKCLRFMPDYSNCLLEGYEVLPGYPTKLKLLKISSSFAIMNWNAPKIRFETVTGYTFHYRKLEASSEYTAIHKEAPPLILENLEPGTFYECYVTASNIHGTSASSSRLVFRTKYQENVEEISTFYNITKCCQAASLTPQCLPLCSYDMKLSDMQTLGPACQTQMAVIVKCAAGGRDHIPCCNRRGVSPTCLPLCRGILPTTSYHIASSECFSYAGNILQCFEDGTENIPGPVENVHAIYVTNTSVMLEWSPPSNISNLNYEYIVQYGKVDNMSMHESIAKLENEMHTNKTTIEISALKTSSIYKILVVVSGSHGTSLPSSMLIVNTTDSNKFNSSAYIFGVPSPPHSLQISSHNANWISISWQPPEFSHPHEIISYVVYHKPTLSDKFILMKTDNLWARLDNLKPNSQHIVYVQAVSSKGASLASETLVAWTDPALPAFVEPPKIQPADLISEGGSMTVLCLAVGNPAPAISLYVGGHLVRQETSRHMVTVIHNVTTDMEHVSCYADNGYGMPMQSTRKIKISYPPRVQASGITVANIGESIDLRCIVRSVPQPNTMFWRDRMGRETVVAGGNYDISLDRNASDHSQYIMSLRILNLQQSDVGDYFCHAENLLGSATSPVSVRIRNNPSVHNTSISECCTKQNVSLPCMAACSYYIDIDLVINKPECIVDFDKLMKCAADGSDHRKCCADNKVPRKCLNWCRGESIHNSEMCSLQHTKTIVNCFETNRFKLPGPPSNLAVNVISNAEVEISWDPPLRNPNSVEGYRIFYHEAVLSETAEQIINSTEINKIDVKGTNVHIEGLKSDVLYELVIKAGNTLGASVLSEPLRFTISKHKLKSISHANTAGTYSGIIAGILFILIAAMGIYFYKRKRYDKNSKGVAFENPSYLKAVEQVQIATMPLGSTIQNTDNKIFNSEQTPQDNHSNTKLPADYEEFKFGNDGI